MVIKMICISVLETKAGSVAFQFDDTEAKTGPTARLTKIVPLSDKYRWIKGATYGLTLEEEGIVTKTGVGELK